MSTWKIHPPIENLTPIENAYLLTHDSGLKVAISINEIGSRMAGRSPTAELARGIAVELADEILQHQLANKS